MMRQGITLAALALLGAWCTSASAAAKPPKAAEPDGRSVKELMADFSSDNPGARMDASRAVAARGKEAVPALIEALKSPDWKVRRSAAAALAGIGRDAADAVPALSETMKDRNAWVREGAAEALGKMGPAAKPAVGLLVEAAGDKDEFLREGVMTALTAICKDPNDNEKQQLVKAACAAVMHPDTGYSVRRLAFPIIDRHGRNYKPAKEALVYMLRHPGQGMWGGCEYKGAEILLEMGDGAEAVGPLTDLLKSQSKGDRKAAGATLGSFGELARPALPALEALAKDDPETAVRDAAKAAVERITTGAAPETVKAKGKGKGKKNK